MKIGISIGDPNGIGPEIILKCFESRDLYKYCIPIVYAAPNILNFYRKQQNKQDIRTQIIKNPSEARPKVLNVIDCIGKTIKVEPGSMEKEGGEMAVSSLMRMAEDLNNNKIQACITAPINKENAQNSGFDFPGQTEFFTKKSNSKESLMLLCSDKMRIGLVTGHVAVSGIKEILNKELIQKKLMLLIKSLKKDFGISKPKVAILGLNPHAGENGKIGKEEIDLIKPIIEEMKNKGELVFGPYPSDGLFGSGNYTKFDGILAMYHDQALIPFKITSFEDGVNYTAGLNIIRTSPDHGTAYDIAGKGIASASSFRQAVYLAIDIARHRNEN